MWEVESPNPNTDEERKASVTESIWGYTIGYCEIMKQCLCL